MYKRQPFFILFYGIMMADMGYGLLMMAASLLVLKKKQPTGGSYNFFALLGLCGISTFFMGALTGGFFGDFIPQMLKVINPESTFTWFWQPLLSPVNDIILIMLGSLALGCVQICNYNCPGQLVIGGEKAAVDKAAELAKQAGARRCIPLKVSGPFHTRLMAPAGDALAKRFAAEPFGEMSVPVLFNCLGREKTESDSIPALLVRQVQSSVYMEDTLHRLGELGVDHILEVGPGNALSGFVKKTLPGVTCVSVETPAQLDTVLNAWKEEQ